MELLLKMSSSASGMISGPGAKDADDRESMVDPENDERIILNVGGTVASSDHMKCNQLEGKSLCQEGQTAAS